MKKGFIFLVLIFVAMGCIFAQENTIDFFGTGNGFKLTNGFSFDVNQFSHFNTRADLTLFADGGAKAPIGGVPFIAGLMNMPLGLWSWIHKDWFGGGMTVGLLAAGIGVFVWAGSEGIGGDSMPIGKLLIATGLIVASPIYGFVRGWSQFNKLKAASLAEAIDDNPLNHIMLVALPAFDKKGVMGAMTYSVSY